MQHSIRGKAYVLGDNIDTDQIIPAQYLTFNPSIPEEYRMFGKYALSGVPPANGGLPKGHVPFHEQDEFLSPYQIVVGGKNFGCGSSREHAPWALADFGISCVIAPSFGDIFYNNSLKNGLLPIRLARAICDALIDDAKLGGNARITIDLQRQVVVRPKGEEIHFDIDPFRKHSLLNGLDDIGQTLQHASRIATYEAARHQAQPWLPTTTA